MKNIYRYGFLKSSRPHPYEIYIYIQNPADSLWNIYMDSLWISEIQPPTAYEIYLTLSENLDIGTEEHPLGVLNIYIYMFYFKR